jgi:hypothetical protein
MSIRTPPPLNPGNNYNLLQLSYTFIRYNSVLIKINRKGVKINI